jgi:hypothetical protein
MSTAGTKVSLGGGGHQCVLSTFFFYCVSNLSFHAAHSDFLGRPESFPCCSVLCGGVVSNGGLLLGNAEANVIYLETPAGVGYSYSADAAYYQGVSDKMTGTFFPITFMFFSLLVYFRFSWVTCLCS